MMPKSLNREMIPFQLTSNYLLSMYYPGSFRCQIYITNYDLSSFFTCSIFILSIVSLQLYFDKVTELTLNKSDSVLFKEALVSLATDSGLHPLVPYFTCFIADEVILLGLLLIFAHKMEFTVPFWCSFKVCASFSIYVRFLVV